MSLVQVIKRAAKEQSDAAQPVAVMYGVVTQDNPLEVSVDQRFTLPADFLVVPEHMTAYSLTIEGQEYEIRRGLEAGDKILLLRTAGGSQLIIVGRLTT
jgi:hypothetical protein